MKRCIPGFRLYVLAMDEETKTALKALNADEITVVSIESVFDEKLKKLLSNRLGASMFWTCTPLIIEHVLTCYYEKWCTYIDADCFFYGDPCRVFDLIEEAGCSVGIVEHRFRKDESYDEHIKSDGRFNVAFNVFRNEENSLKILREWKEQCLEQCTNRPTEGLFGDQLYLNEWPGKYRGVYIIEDDGIDVAPWNVNNYRVTKRGDDYWISNDHIDRQILMYHFHTLNHISKHIVSLNLWNTKRRSEIKDLLGLYRDYIDECNRQQVIASKYVSMTEDAVNTGIGEKIKGFCSKYKNRKENSLVQMFRNVMWI